MPKTLIIDDDITFCTMLKALLERNNHNVDVCYSSKGVSKLISDTFYDIILSDIRLPDSDGMELLKLFAKVTPRSQVIMLTSYANYTTAIRSIKEGAFSYIPKPFTPDEVLNIINDALHESKQPSKKIKSIENADNQYIEGNSNASKQLQQYIKLVAPTQISVLITGKSGTGKEYVAKTIHRLSSRSAKPFVAVDCGAIPKELVASEFFGHVKGSFTGAHEDKTGHFEAANGGTLFLDEVGNLSYNTQIQLLRVLQEREIRPVGSNKVIQVDIRLIAATNEDLKQSIDDGTFREDLYHRLNEFDFKVPSLSERQDDILVFAQHFLLKANDYLKKNIIGFDDESKKVLSNYNWPGNLRELENIIKRATLLATGQTITMAHLPEELITQKTNSSYALKDPSNEKEMILRALEVTNNNKTKTARLLQIDRKTLYNKLKLHNITDY